MATWNAIIAASEDDARQAGLAMTLDDAIIIFNAGTQWGGLRFLNCPIAPGDSVDEVHLTFDVFSTSYDDPGGMGIYGQATDNPIPFTLDDGSISARNRTTNFVAWNGTNIGAGDQSSPDVAAVLNEIINGGYGYTQGNPVAFILDPTGSTIFRFRAYDGSTTTCVRLTATYTPAAGTAGPLVNGPRLKSKLRGLV